MFVEFEKVKVVLNELIFYLRFIKLSVSLSEQNTSTVFLQWPLKSPLIFLVLYLQMVIN